MSSSLNKVMLIGNLGRDTEVRRTAAGDPIANLRIATSESWTDKATGEKKERTEWHSVVVFNPGLAGVIERFTKKGSKVYVEGQLQTRKWTDQTGIERYSTEIVLPKFGGQLTLLSSSGNGGDRPPPAESQDSYGTTRSREPAPAQRHADLDDDIPF